MTAGDARDYGYRSLAEQEAYHYWVHPGGDTTPMALCPEPSCVQAELRRAHAAGEASDG